MEARVSPKTSRAGAWSDMERGSGSCVSPPGGLKATGLTLLELLVVIAVLGLIIAIVYPRISDIGTARLRKEAGRVASLITYLSESSATRKVYYMVWFDLDNEALSVEASKNGVDFTPATDEARGFKLWDGVFMEDIALPGTGTVNAGTIPYLVKPTGAGPLRVHLKGDSVIYTVIFNPYSAKTDIRKGYVQ